MGNARTSKKSAPKRFRNSVGPAVRRLRNAREWTQADLATKLQLVGLNLDRADVAKIEGQLRSVYDFELFILADILEADPIDFRPRASTLKSDLPFLRKGLKPF